MQAIVIWLTFFGTCAVLCHAELVDYGEDDLSWDGFAEMLSEMPENKKYEFVKSHFLRGYELAQQDIDDKGLDEDLKLSLSIYHVVKEMSQNIEEDKVLLQRNSQICFPSPIGCIDSGDAGVRPS